jgi:lactoylglutathione lyase
MFRFHHVHLRSPDPEATADYYQRMFGADVTRAVYPAGSPYAGQPRIAMMLGGQRVLLAPAHPTKPNAVVEQPYFGVEHIALAVDDIDAAVAALDAKGAEFWQRPKPTPTGNRNAFVRAPQGVLVELVQVGGAAQAD